MPSVKQVRALRNVVLTGLSFATLLWLMRDHLLQSLDAVAYGILCGIGVGLLYSRKLRRAVTRRGRRFERNKVLVNYMNVGEIALTAVAYNHYLAIPIVLLFVIAFLFGHFSAHWWMVFAGTSGLSGSIALGAEIFREEQKSGPLYYQYDSRSWQGAEGMLYQVGDVVRPLAPRGMVRVKGELWSAVSAAGETIEVGERVEVLSVNGLTLSVDRLPSESVQVPGAKGI
jgi:membrane protein implicated in regulation of membrane protease activity